MLLPLGFLGFAFVDDNLYDEGDDDHGGHDQPEIISIHILQCYGCLFSLQQAVQTFLLSLFCSTMQNRLRKSKNDKKEKNVTNELVFAGRYAELRVKSHGERVEESEVGPYGKQPLGNR